MRILAEPGKRRSGFTGLFVPLPKEVKRLFPSETEKREENEQNRSTEYKQLRKNEENRKTANESVNEKSHSILIALV